MTDEKPYRELDHTADVAVEISAATWPALLEAAVWTLTDLMTESSAVRPEREERIAIELDEPDRVELVVRLLAELLYRLDVERFIAARAEVVAADDRRVEARLFGESYDPDRHGSKAAVKAVTYHRADVRETGGRWTATLVFDV